MRRRPDHRRLSQTGQLDMPPEPAKLQRLRERLSWPTGGREFRDIPCAGAPVYRATAKSLTEAIDLV
jgi:hypothetical protein